MSKAKAGAGFKLNIGDGASPEVFTAVVEVKSVKAGEVTIKTDDVTNLDSPADSNGVIFEETITTIASAGELDITYNLIPSLTGGQAKLRTYFDGQLHNVQVVSTFLNTANSPATKFTLSGAAYIIAMDGFDVSVDKAVTGSAKLKFSGPRTWA